MQNGRSCDNYLCSMCESTAFFTSGKVTRKSAASGPATQFIHNSLCTAFTFLIPSNI
jgi:hypothetical protein